MKKSIFAFTIASNDSVINALKKIDSNKVNNLFVIDSEERLLGVLPESVLRQCIINGGSIFDSISSVYLRKVVSIKNTCLIEDAIELINSHSITFLPIVDSDDHLVNIVTKQQLSYILLQDIHSDLNYDFSSIDENEFNNSIFFRPWGFYWTSILNNYFQSKVITVKPGGQLSLQSHVHREEHWTIVYGKGTVRLDDSIINVSRGQVIYIPKGCKHRLINTDKKENLIISEVQIGDYFGEDDIIRYEDAYGRD